MNSNNKIIINPWKVMLILSIIFMGGTLFIMSNGSNILPTAFKLAGSSQSVDEIESAARGFMNLSMLKPLWEGIWAGILGLYIAFLLKRREKHAWILGLFWGIMFLSHAILQGGYEMVVLGWSVPCPQTFFFLLLGSVSLSCILLCRKDYLTITSSK